MIVRIAEKICNRLGVLGITLYPFVLLRSKELAANAILLNHERIHIRQQAELLVLPFYLIYLSHYLYNLLLYRQHYQAYRNICFEREAYAHESDLNYLEKRRWGAAFRYWKDPND